MEIIHDESLSIIATVFGTITEQQKLFVHQRIEAAGRSCLEDWKRFEAMCSSSSSPTDPPPTRPAKIRKNIDEPHPPRRGRK
eukprot:5086263-Heterocapsa_arctica.AAC.1